MNPDGGDVEGMALRNANDCDVESNLIIGMQEYTTIGNGDLDRTWFSE